VERSDTHAVGALESMGIATLHTILRSCSTVMQVLAETLVADMPSPIEDTPARLNTRQTNRH